MRSELKSSVLDCQLLQQKSTQSQMGSKSPWGWEFIFEQNFVNTQKFLRFSRNRLPGEFSVNICDDEAVSQFVWADDLPGSVIYHIWANPCILQYALSNKRSLGGGIGGK